MLCTLHFSFTSQSIKINKVSIIKQCPAHIELFSSSVVIPQLFTMSQNCVFRGGFDKKHQQVSIVPKLDYLLSIVQGLVPRMHCSPDNIHFLVAVPAKHLETLYVRSVSCSDCALGGACVWAVYLYLYQLLTSARFSLYVSPFVIIWERLYGRILIEQNLYSNGMDHRFYPVIFPRIFFP